MRVSVHAIKRFQQRIEFEQEGDIIHLLLNTVSNKKNEVIWEMENGGWGLAIPGYSKHGKKFWAIESRDGDIVTVLDDYQFQNRKRDLLKT